MSQERVRWSVTQKGGMKLILEFPEKNEARDRVEEEVKTILRNELRYQIQNRKEE